MITSISLKRAIKVAALSVAFAASGSGIALAGTTSGNNGILGGNQISVPVSVPVSICGNAVAVLGQALGLCQGGASTGGSGSSGGSGSTTSGNDSVGGGNQVSVPISVPVDVCGNSVAVLGTAVSHCGGGSSTGTPPPHKPGPPPHKPGPPPAHHRHHHHHGRPGTPVTPHLPTAAVTGTSTLPTTGANFVGLLALAGSVTVGGAGSLMLLARRGLAHGAIAFARRATRAFASAR
jgi:hypothetical protein